MEESNVIFSVLMSVYNTSKEMLKNAVDSVLRQEFSQWELIILDNGNLNDDTWSVLEEYNKKDKRIKPIRIEKNVGWPKGASICLEHTSGQYMTFLAADDNLIGDKCFGRLYEEIKKNNNPDIVWVGYTVSNLNGHKQDIILTCVPNYAVLDINNRLDNIFNILGNTYYNSFFHYVRIDLLKEHGIDFYNPFYADCGGITEAMCRAGKMVIVDEPIYNLTYNTSQTKGAFMWDSYKIIFGVQWNSLKGCFLREGYYDKDIYAGLVRVLFNNMMSEISGLCEGVKTRDMLMQPLVKSNIERLIQVEKILENEEYAEMFYYYGREKAAVHIVEIVKVLYERCCEEYGFNVLEEKMNWLHYLLAALNNEASAIEFAQKALMSGHNKYFFGYELMDTQLKQDKLIKEREVQYKLYCIQRMLKMAEFIHDMNTEYVEYSLLSIRADCFDILIDISSKISRPQMLSKRSEIEVRTQI